MGRSTTGKKYYGSMVLIVNMYGNMQTRLLPRSTYRLRTEKMLLGSGLYSAALGGLWHVLLTARASDYCRFKDV
jgi:hypothetical protein